MDAAIFWPNREPWAADGLSCEQEFSLQCWRATASSSGGSERVVGIFKGKRRAFEFEVVSGLGIAIMVET